MRLTYGLCAFLIRWLTRLLFGLTIRGSGKIPQRGRAIIAANHQSYLDPPILGCCLRREVKYLAKEELFKIPIFGGIIRHLGAIPIKRSRLDLDAMRKVTEILESENVVVLFPEGTRSLTGEMRKGLGGVGFLARQTNTEVYPVYIDNTRGAWRRLGKRQAISVTIGDPIRLAAPLDQEGQVKSEAYRDFSDKVMKQIAALKAADS